MAGPAFLTRFGRCFEGADKAEILLPEAPFWA